MGGSPSAIRGSLIPSIEQPWPLQKKSCLRAFDADVEAGGSRCRAESFEGQEEEVEGSVTQRLQCSTSRLCHEVSTGRSGTDGSIGRPTVTEHKVRTTFHRADGKPPLRTQIRRKVQNRHAALAGVLCGRPVTWLCREMRNPNDPPLLKQSGRWQHLLPWGRAQKRLRRRRTDSRITSLPLPAHCHWLPGAAGVHRGPCPGKALNRLRLPSTGWVVN